MVGGRLKIINESRYPDEEVERLVRFGLQEIDLTGDGVVAAIQDTRPTKRRLHGQRDFSGTAWSLNGGGIPLAKFRRYIGRRKISHLIVMRIGPPQCFPIRPFTRNGQVTDYRTWQEALVGITAHEGMHAQHAYDYAYTRRATVLRRHPEFGVIRQKRRIGSQRIEPKCEAFEAGALRRFRAQDWKSPAAFATVRADQEGGAVA